MGHAFVHAQGHVNLAYVDVCTRYIQLLVSLIKYTYGHIVTDLRLTCETGFVAYSRVLVSALLPVWSK